VVGLVSADNPVAGLSEYELHHLGDHLAEAGDAFELDRLLALEMTAETGAPPAARPRKRRRRWPSLRWRTPETQARFATVIVPQNAWYEAKEAIGDATGYRADIGRAWRLAAEASEAVLTAGQGAGVDREVRCALLEASALSVGRNLPGSFVRAMVERGGWSEAHALSYAGQGDLLASQEKMAALLPALSSETRAETLSTLLGSLPDAQRAGVLETIAPFLDLQQAEAVRAELRTYTDDEYKHSMAARAIAVRLAELGAVADAFAVAITESPHENEAAETLTVLAPLLDETQIRAGLAAAREWGPPGSFPIACVGLAARLGALGHVDEALDIGRSIDLPYQRARLVVQLVPVCERSRQPALFELLPPPQSSADDLRAQAMLAAALATSGEGDNEATAALVDDAIRAIKVIDYEHSRMQAVLAVLPELIALRPEVVLQLARSLGDADCRVGLLSAAASQLPEALADQARAEVIATADGRRDLGTDGIKGLAAIDATRAFERAQQIVADGGTPAQTLLVDIAPYLGREQLAQTRRAFARIDDGRNLSDARIALAGERAVCGDSTGLEPLNGEGPRYGYDQRIEVLAHIAPRVPDELLDATFERVAALSGHDLEEPVKAFAPRLSVEQQHRLLDQTGDNDYDWAYAKVAQSLSPYLGVELLGFALQRALTRKDAAWRAWSLVALIPRLNLEQVEQVRRQPSLGADMAFQQDSLSRSIATRLAELGFPDDALKLGSASQSLDVVRALAPSLCRDGPSEQLARVVDSVAAPEDRAEGLALLASYAEGTDRSRLLDAALAGGFGSVPSQSNAVMTPTVLARLARWARPELFDRALAAAQAGDDYVRRDVVAALGPLDSTEAAAAAKVARDIVNDGPKAEAFLAIVEATNDLPFEVVVDAVRAVAAHDFYLDRRSQLRTVIGRLVAFDAPSVHAEWSAVLAAATGRGRAELLSDIAGTAEAIGVLGGLDALIACETAIQDVARWWP
jgi:hypothetical protein